MNEKRTTQQNKALHLYYKKLAEELNAAGLDMRKTLKPEVEIPWTPANVKEYLWRPIQKAQLGKESTRDLTTSEIDKVYDTINRHMAQKHKIYVAFPSEEELYYEQNKKK